MPTPAASPHGLPKSNKFSAAWSRAQFVWRAEALPRRACNRIRLCASRELSRHAVLCRTRRVHVTCNSVRNSARHNHDHDHDHAITIIPTRTTMPGTAMRRIVSAAAFAIGASLNAAFVVAELVFGYAANSLALISDAVHNLSDVIALLLAWGAAWLAAEAADATPHLRLSARVDPGGAVQCRPAADRGRRHRGRGDQPPARARGGRGLDRGGGRGARHPHQWRHRADVHARPSWRSQYSRRLSAHGGRRRRLARRGGRGAGDHADGMAVARSRDQPVIAAVVFWSGWGLARDSVNLALDGVPRGIDLAEVRDYLAGLDGVAGGARPPHLGDEHQRDRADRASGAARRP